MFFAAASHKLEHKRAFSAVDKVLFQCLKRETSIETRYELVAMPYESVVDQPSFHEKLGPLFLLRHMHQAQSDPSLQVHTKTTLRAATGTIDHRVCTMATHS